VTFTFKRSFRFTSVVLAISFLSAFGPSEGALIYAPPQKLWTSKTDQQERCCSAMNEVWITRGDVAGRSFRHST